jgi:cysteinyl-tRNA synthetase
MKGRQAVTDEATQTGREIAVDLSAMALRYFLLSGHYRSKLDMNDHALNSARKALRRLLMSATPTQPPRAPVEVIDALSDDLNTPKAIAIMHGYRKAGRGEDLFGALHFLGLLSNATSPDDVRMLPRRPGVPDHELFGGHDLSPGDVARPN